MNLNIHIMKIKNIFKKENKTVAKATIETLAKNQLEKVVGGADATTGNTFGEKVNSGLHAAGGALAQGASLLGTSLPGGGK
jgi:hypothetical protein